jgi:hypothetical protein
MLLLHVAPKLLHLGDRILRYIERAFPNDWPSRIVVELSLRIETEPEEGLDIGCSIKLLAQDVAGLQELLLYNEESKEVDLYYHHAYNELDDKHSFVRYCVLSLLAPALPASTLHGVLILDLLLVTPSHVLKLLVV